MFERIYNLLVSFLGESKNGYDSQTYQYQFDCPCCAEEKGVPSDGKKNLEVNLKMGKYHCWACGDTNGTKGNITKLIRDYGNPSILREYREQIEQLKRSKLYSLDCFKENDLPILEDSYIKLPKSYKHIVIDKLNNKKLKDYLAERHIDQKLIDQYNIGFTDNSEPEAVLRNRIIIPSYDAFGELNFWTGRDFTKNPKRLKYYNVKTDKKNIIFNEKNINWNGDIFLVEGPLDKLSCPPNTISLLGKSLSKNSLLFHTLYNIKNNGKIIIFLDGDAKNDVKKIYKTLNYGRLKGKIWYVPINEDLDPSDLYCKYGKAGMIKLLRMIRQFNEIELLMK